MNLSTKNVTLYAVFVCDILKHYEDKKEQYRPLFDMAGNADLSEPFNKVPIQLYNDMCAWIENELGKFNLIVVGRKIGETAYQGMIDNGLIKKSATPFEIMEGLVKVANEMIQDPEKRGWEVVKCEKSSVTMRKTQTFNRNLQLGLLDGLIRKSGVGGVKVDYSKSIEAGATYDEYLITWI
jgi:hypothetical protein